MLGCIALVVPHRRKTRFPGIVEGNFSGGNPNRIMHHIMCCMMQNIEESIENCIWKFFCVMVLRAQSDLCFGALVSRERRH